jgi:hypothetical protein
LNEFFIEKFNAITERIRRGGFMNKKWFKKSSNYREFIKISNERFRQAKTSFNLAMLVASIGVLLLIVSFIVICMDIKSLGYLCSAIAVILNVVARFLFKLHKDANDRLDKILPLL